MYSNSYFWRTHAQQGIDYIEERAGILYAYEFKWSGKKRAKPPGSFTAAYPNHEFQCINRGNYLDFLI